MERKMGMDVDYALIDTKAHLNTICFKEFLINVE